VSGRILRQPREQRGLGQRELAHVLAEVRARRGLDAVGAVPVVDLVEVHLEDLGLRVHLLDAERDHQLLELAVERALVRQEQVAGELLRDRRAALRRVEAEQVRDRGAQDAAQVDAPVAVEVAVFRREWR
jgi:hypothetical protein